MTDSDVPTPLKRGWTTGSCATAAARAAVEGLRSGSIPDPVEIGLPSGARVSFAVATAEIGRGFARAGVVKDAGDDPDVTHGALVVATVFEGAPGSGVTFRAGKGVGTVTRAGLPLPPGEPAINPVPRQMIRAALAEAAAKVGGGLDIIVEISIPDGEKLAERTLNGRLGIVGGLSILGTTGIVIPFSCAAWISSIHRGIDVARAAGLGHVAAATGSTSEAAIQRLYDLPDMALIDMGDFAGGTLKYLAKHPVQRVTICGGIAKMVKLGQGMLDLHSKRGTIDLAWLAVRMREIGGSEELVARVPFMNSALEVLQAAERAGLDLGAAIAARGWQTAAAAIRGTGIELEVVVFDREGGLIGHSELRRV